MTAATEAFKTWARDNQVAGVAGSGVNEPSKSEFRAAADKLGQELAALATGQNVKEPVVAATTGNINLASALVNGAVIDGVTVETGDRVLVWKQSSPAQNGIYIVAASGAASRSADADEPSEVLGTGVYVSGGATNGYKHFNLLTPQPIVLGTTPLSITPTVDQAAVNAAAVQPLVDAAAASASAAAASASAAAGAVAAETAARQAEIRVTAESIGRGPDMTDAVSPAASTATGATYANGRLTLATGSTGDGSSITAFFPLNTEPHRATERMIIVQKFRTSPNLLANLTNYPNGMQAIVDGVLISPAHQSGSMTIAQTAVDEVTITGEYANRGGFAQSVGIYLQLYCPATADPSGSRWIEPAATTYYYKDSSVADALKVVSDLNAVSSGDLLPYVTPELTAASGVTLSADGRGMVVAAGAFPAGSYITFPIVGDNAAFLRRFPGSVLTFTFWVKSTNWGDNYIGGGIQTVSLSDVFTPGAALSAPRVARQPGSNMHVVEIDYKVVGNEKALLPLIYSPNNTPFGSTGTATVFALFFRARAVGNTPGAIGAVTSPAALEQAWRSSISAPALLRGVNYIATYYVGPGRTYATPADIVTAGLRGLDEFNAVKIVVDPGVYDVLNLMPPPYTHWYADGPADSVWFRGYLAPDTAVDTIIGTFTIDTNHSFRMYGIRVTCQNMRYPYHNDWRFVRDMRHYFEDCTLEHFGNDEAVAYRNGIGDTVGRDRVYGSVTWALGHGSASGQIAHFKRVKFRSVGTPVYMHPAADMSAPSLLILEDCDISSFSPQSSAGIYIDIPAGPGHMCKIEVKNSAINGKIVHHDSAGWGSSLKKNRWSNRRAAVQVTLEGCGPVAVQYDPSGATTLELRSTPGASSAIRVTGNLFTVLFGANPIYKAGSVGLAARVFAQWFTDDVNAACKLGALLGDCTSVNKTGQVYVDGGSPVTVTMSANYTAMTNAEVLTALNTALGALPAAFYLNSDYFDKVSAVRQPEYEAISQNTGTTAILRGQRIAYNDDTYSRRHVRLMTSADPVTKDAGTALEDIPVGAVGRHLLPEVPLHQTQLRFSGTPAFDVGDTYGIDPATPGNLLEGAATPLLINGQKWDGSTLYKI